MAPIPYPAVFDVPAGGLLTNLTIAGAYFVNPFRLLSMEPGSGGGRVFMTNTRAFCIDRCFDIRSALSDTIQLDDTDYFGPGVYGDVAPVGKQYLSRYSAGHAELFHLDPGAGHYVDGLLIGGAMVQSMRYGIHVLSGVLDVSKVSGLDLDSTPTALRVEGTATAFLSWQGGTIYSSQVFAPAASQGVFEFASNSQMSDLTITGVSIPYAQGSVVVDSSLGLRHLNFSGNNVTAWGQTASTGNTYYAVAIGNNPVAQAVISNNVLTCRTASGKRVVGNPVAERASTGDYGKCLFRLRHPDHGERRIGPDLGHRQCQLGHLWQQVCHPRPWRISLRGRVYERDQYDEQL